MTMGKKIRDRRKELKMSQTELAHRTGYADKSAISKIEHDAVELGQKGILKFAKVLDIDYRYLMDWTDIHGNEKKEEQPKLTDEEIELLYAYRLVDERTKSAIRILLNLKGRK